MSSGIEYNLVVGSDAGRIECSRVVGRVAVAVDGMLWKLDRGRKVLRLPGKSDCTKHEHGGDVAMGAV